MSSEGILRAQKQAGSQRPRFYVPSQALAIAGPGAVYELTKEETRHALRVLRLREGHSLEVCDGAGRVQQARLGGLTHTNVAYVEATGAAQQVAWSGPKWELVAAVGGLKGTRDDWLVEKATELGAWSFQPLLTQRARTLGKQAARHQVKVVSVAEVSEDEGLEEAEDVAHVNQMARWRRLADAATKQSLRAHRLRILSPISMAAISIRLESAPVSFVAAAGAPPLLEVLQDMAPALKAASQAGGACVPLVVGPEGDFTGVELEALIGSGATPTAF
ncbi:hypothetical protein WJX73_009071 [Symbiochloris irregularis]|uniref:16S rRNA (uracil(1498)-N(3))-methyltransferase n=1 Tax=Symbiochloris irregularis TaxID=706552 RepID=A0AAW1NXI6_9CHLO